ncbi:DEAD/DEAH box helicase [Auraticoccus monumenti]|uniref:SWIM zinc finger n=1 Tax=Auraticoccus monumenti TaxID=675864 RepID=A0A1G6Y0N3_9ACTN|nr:DEAD/DEAH box helicase [Auraticoccus monumenti]SDD83870.1 SWIM zinc finger [Auraticoccus monumenti]
MLLLSDLATSESLEGWVDPESIVRGTVYARAGRVLQTEVHRSEGRVVVVGVVEGGARYAVRVSVTERESVVRGRTTEVDVECSCPLSWACKHAVAAVLVAAETHGAADAWRTTLDALADASDGSETPGEPTPLALMVTVPKQPRHRFDPGGAVGRPRLTLRLSRQGSSGRWLRSGFGWRELASAELDRRARYDPQQLALLREVQIALKVGQPYWSPGADALELHLAGPTLWPLLERAAEVGVALVCSAARTEVEVAPGTATLELDLSSRADGVTGRLGASHDGRWVDPADVAFVGDPAHGLVLWGERPGGGTTITLARLDRPVPAPVRNQVVRQSPLVVPPEGVPELFGQYLPRLRRSVQVGSRDGSVELPGPPRPRLRAQLTWHEDASAELAWRWVYELGGGQVADLPVNAPDVAPGTRDRERERELLDTLEPTEELAVLLGLGERGGGTLHPVLVLRGADAMVFAEDRLPELRRWAAATEDVELVVLGDEPDFREATGTPQVRFTPSDGTHRAGRTDWLELEVVITIDDAALGTCHLGLAQVLEALASGQTKVMVRKGVYLDVDRPELDQLARLVADAQALVDQPRDRLVLTRDHHDLLADLAELAEGDDRVRRWTEAASALRDLPATPPPPEPEGLRATLRPYQRDGYRWLSFLHEHGLGGVLADDMGLGKTLQTLAMIARAREQDAAAGRSAPPFLVVAPSSVVSTWVAEARRFTPGLRVLAVTESAARRGWPLDRPPAVALPESPEVSGPPDVVVTTYTLVRLEAQGYAARPWAGLVLDEAQAVKNHRSKTHAAVRAVEAGSRFAITGTPMENNLMELWSILQLTAPGIFPWAKEFSDHFAQPIEQDADTDALALLRRRIRPVVLRRTKDVVAADLPAKQEQVLSVALGPRHRKIYDTHLHRERQRVLKLLEDLDENRITVLASLTRLRQLSLDPALVDPEHDGVGSAKIDALVDHLTEVAAEGHRALVFSQFTGFLRRVRARLDAAGLSHAYLDGSTRNRADEIERFRTGTDPAFLISLKAGGVGLTLTEADYCFLLDPWWNPAAEAQAIDRTHRIGQTRNVVVYRMVSEGTIEEKVMELSRRKAALFANVVDGESLAATELTADDIAGLLGGP